MPNAFHDSLKIFVNIAIPQTLEVTKTDIRGLREYSSSLFGTGYGWRDWSLSNLADENDPDGKHWQREYDEFERLEWKMDREGLDAEEEERFWELYSQLDGRGLYR